MSRIHTAINCHPAVSIAYACIAMVLVMAHIQPALSAIAFACVAAFGALATGWRSFARRLRWQLPLIAGIMLLNGIFVQRGATVLFRIGDYGLHAESLVYGLSMGLALATAMEIFALLGDVVPSDDALAVFGRRFPHTALLASMALRLIPRMRRNAEERRDALKACTALPQPASKAKAAADDVSVLIANAMEDSLVTADSMRARGYGSGRKRTRYAQRRFMRADAGALALVLALGAVAFAADMAAASAFAFYPRIEGGANVGACLAFATYFLLPSVAFAVETARWQRVKEGV